ncbi:MAG: hypothetical protein ABUK01_13545 [Leptospirales bacterium]
MENSSKNYNFLFNELIESYKTIGKKLQKNIIFSIAIIIYLLIDESGKINFFGNEINLENNKNIILILLIFYFFSIAYKNNILKLYFLSNEFDKHNKKHYKVEEKNEYGKPIAKLHTKFVKAGLQSSYIISDNFITDFIIIGKLRAPSLSRSIKLIFTLGIITAILITMITSKYYTGCSKPEVCSIIFVSILITDFILNIYIVNQQIINKTKYQIYYKYEGQVYKDLLYLNMVLSDIFRIEYKTVVLVEMLDNEINTLIAGIKENNKIDLNVNEEKKIKSKLNTMYFNVFQELYDQYQNPLGLQREFYNYKDEEYIENIVDKKEYGKELHEFSKKVMQLFHSIWRVENNLYKKFLLDMEKSGASPGEIKLLNIINDYTKEGPLFEEIFNNYFQRSWEQTEKNIQEKYENLWDFLQDFEDNSKYIMGVSFENDYRAIIRYHNIPFRNAGFTGEILKTVLNKPYIR